MAKIMVLAEADGEHILPTSAAAIRFSQELARTRSESFDILLSGGPAIREQIEVWQRYGAESIWYCAQTELQHPTADRIAVVCVEAMQRSGADSLVGVSSTFGRDVLPRAAEMLDLPMVSDVLAIVPESEGRRFRRPMYAGNVIATVEIAEPAAVFTVRGAAFGNPETYTDIAEAQEMTIPSASLPDQTEWRGVRSTARSRPDLAAARVVVSGGRPLRDAETFEKLLGGLADSLGGAVGATRAAVDSGIAPNDLQVGQTGRIVAPELYIAAGVSGSIQHLAGMKDSKVIVAINTDPEAPIFSVADYGLVADLHKAIPELLERIRSAKN